MRTTIDLDDTLFRELKQEAARRGITLRELLRQFLRKELAAPKRPVNYRFHWKTHRGHLQPGVRLDDRESLFDLMEGR